MRAVSQKRYVLLSVNNNKHVQGCIQDSGLGGAN